MLRESFIFTFTCKENHAGSPIRLPQKICGAFCVFVSDARDDSLWTAGILDVALKIQPFKD
jgi:hypothetical protein